MAIFVICFLLTNMGDNLKEKMIGAVAWTSIDRFGMQLVQFAVGLALARLVSPENFGLMGMVMIFLPVSTLLVDGGFGQALVRKQDADEKDFSTVFFFNIIISLVLYLILFFTAPLIAAFFAEPQLVGISRILFLIILINSLYLIPIAKLQRDLDFKGSAKINISSIVCSSIISVILAFNGFQIWALVLQQVLFHFFRLLFFQIYVKWIPGFIFSFQTIRELGKFSIHLLGTNMLNAVFNQIYVIILGKYYTKYETGLYYQANKLNETTNSTFQTILIGSTYSLLVKIQDDDERFRRIFRGIATKISAVTIPLMFILASVALPLIVVLYSDVWVKAVPYFQLLTLSAIFAPLYGLNINALNARGKSRITFRIEIIKKALILISVFVCFQWGIMPMLAGYIVSCYAAYGISMFFIKSNLTHYIRHQITDFAGYIGIGILVAACNFGISFLISDYYLLLTAQLVVSGILYLICMKLFYNQLYTQASDFLNDKLKLIRKKQA